MSSEDRHVADWIRALFAALARGEPRRAEIIRRLADQRRATMVLGDQAASVRFAGDRLMVRKVAKGRPLPPSGSISRSDVVAILSGYLEVAEAISTGRLDLVGRAEDVIDMCAIIEVLIDASTRIPAMQELAAEFVQQAVPDGREERRLRRSAAASLAERERAFLVREGLAD